MKKMIFLLIMSLFFVIAQASHLHIYLDSVGNNSTHKPCADSAIFHKVTGALTNVTWNAPGIGSIHDVDTFIILLANSGRITFYSSETGSKAVYCYLFSTLPTKNLRDTSFCSLGFAYNVDLKNPYCSYFWNDGNQQQTRSFTTFGTWWARINGGCGNTWDTVTISHINPNPTPNLGSDKIVCGGSSVVLNPGYPGLFTSYYWQSNQTTNKDTGYTTGWYWVETTDTSGCLARDSVYVTFTTPDSQSLCAAVFDSITWKNRLYWYRDVNSNISSLVIYTRDINNNMSPIDTVPYNTNNWQDINSNPQDQQYEYAVAPIDTCNQLGPISFHHKTIRLTIGQFSNMLSFSWTDYVGITVPNYTLYGIKLNGSVHTIITLPASYLGYNYNSFDTAYHKYYVGFVVPSCTHRATLMIRSNNVDYKGTGIQDLSENLFKIYPNPASDIINIESPIEVSAIIFNATGQQIVSKGKASNFQINISSFPSGIYLLQLQDPNTAVNYYSRKVFLFFHFFVLLF